VFYKLCQAEQQNQPSIYIHVIEYITIHLRNLLPNSFVHIYLFSPITRSR